HSMLGRAEWILWGSGLSSYVYLFCSAPFSSIGMSARAVQSFSNIMSSLFGRLIRSTLSLSLLRKQSAAFSARTAKSFRRPRHPIGMKDLESNEIGKSRLQLSVLDQSPVPAGSTPGQALQNSIELARLVDG